MNRKIICFTVLVCVAAAGAFAQMADGISFSMWGRGAFAPLVIFNDAVDADGEILKDHRGNTYVGTGIRPGYGFEHELYFTGNYNNVGFELGLAYDGEESPGATSARYWYNYLGAAIWVQPLGNEWLKVTGGTFNDTTLRGKIGEVNEAWEEFVLPGAGYKDEIFTSFGGEYQGVRPLGFMLSSVPMEGLFIGVRVNAPGLDVTTIHRAAYMYRYIQIGAGYEIPGIGHARLQYMGGYIGNDNNRRLQKYIDDSDYNGPLDNLPRELLPRSRHGNPARVEGAFAFTAIDDLLVDVGVKMFFPVLSSGTLSFPSEDVEIDYHKSSRGFAVSAGAIYNFGDIGFTGRIDSTFGSYDRTSEDAKNYYNDDNYLTLDLRLVPTYNLGFATVGLDFGYAILRGNYIDVNGDPLDPSRAMSRWGIGGFIRRGFSNGHIKAGITYTSPIIFANDQKERMADKMIQIPIVMEYSF